jgi:hypothetical protein
MNIRSIVKNSFFLIYPGHLNVKNGKGNSFKC